jgi:hypothetical protein
VAQGPRRVLCLPHPATKAAQDNHVPTRRTCVTTGLRPKRGPSSFMVNSTVRVSYWSLDRGYGFVSTGPEEFFVPAAAVVGQIAPGDR